jgi:hypothetical protein
MPYRRKLIVFGLAGAAVITVALIAGWFQSMRPLTEQEVLAAKRVDFVEEVPIPDGGSYVFHFRLPHKRSMAVQVVHRHTGMGGNPDFQEIRLDRFGAMSPYIDLRPGSPLEAKLLSLLQNAGIDTNAAAPDAEFTSPRPERLRWLMDRIRDRKAKW